MVITNLGKAVSPGPEEECARAGGGGRRGVQVNCASAFSSK